MLRNMSKSPEKPQKSSRTQPSAARSILHDESAHSAKSNNMGPDYTVGEIHLAGDLPDIDLDDLASDAADKEEAGSQGIALPDHVAGSGSLDRLVDQARRLCRRRHIRKHQQSLQSGLGAFFQLVPAQGCGSLLTRPPLP